ncbi:MAG: LLM class flavin-dependent oxidoreductase [Candidatus Bathyarchaeota archaeon]|nr:MAG: LLM class flavin-dependent oxidoreductase [Candidatus Bathyarchaeota archaeon]
MVKFGINLQLEEYSIDLALKTAQLADDLGIHAVFVNDHYMKPHGSNIPDAFLMLTAMALQTKRILLGTAVTPIPFRSAAQTAKIVSTLDNLNKGRSIFGVGAGWYQTEFEGYGSQFMPPKERVSKTIEGIRLMKRLWTEEEVTFQGRYYRTKGTVLLPKPLQKPHPPILIGSRSRRMRLAAAREGNGWIPGHLPLKDYENMMNEIIKEAEKHGKRRDDLTFVHFTRILTGPHMDEVRKSLSKSQIEQITERYIVGSPESCVEKLQKYVDIGVDLILLRLHHIAPTSFVKEKKHRQQIALIYNEIFSQLEE